MFCCNTHSNIPTPAVPHHINPPAPDTNSEWTPLLHVSVLGQPALTHGYFPTLLENSPPRFKWTWQDCSHGSQRTSHHPQCVVANSREILMKMGSASNKCHCCGWYGDRRQATWYSEWLCPSPFASTLREQAIVYYYNVRFNP